MNLTQIPDPTVVSVSLLQISDALFILIYGYRDSYCYHRTDRAQEPKVPLMIKEHALLLSDLVNISLDMLLKYVPNQTTFST